jgi:glycosyltransferase 2 family protein
VGGVTEDAAHPAGELPAVVPSLRRPPRPGWVLWARAAVLLLSVGLFVRVLWMADLPSVGRLLAHIGPLVVLAVVPYGLTVVADTAGWRAILLGLEARVALRRLLGVRLSTEAVHISFPGGPILAEGLKVWFLARRAGVPVPESTASLTVKKALQIGTQGIYVLAAAAVSGPWLRELSRALGDHVPLRPLMVGIGLFLCAVAAGAVGVLLSGRLAGRLWSFLFQFPSRRVRAWVTTHQSTFLAIDTHAREVLRSHVWGLAVAAAWILIGWFMEAAESWLLLWLLGVELPYGAVLAFEPVVSFARSAAFFVPAGLGVQDGGYMAMLRGFGIPDATNRAAAFVLLKRFKEVFWIVVGWTLFLATRHSRLPGPVVSSDAGRSVLPGSP